MTRAFVPDPIPAALLDDLLDRSRQAPSAGNTAATRFLVLDTPTLTERYWQRTFTPEGRAQFRWQGLFDAPALVVLMTDPEAYVRRYAEPDKARAKLGASTQGWAVPYWWVDAGAVAQNLLLLAQDAGLGACLFGLFDHAGAVAEEFGVATNLPMVATIALGTPLTTDGANPPGRSARRPRPPLTDILYRPS